MMSWMNTLRTSAEDLGTLAENDPPTTCVPTVDAESPTQVTAYHAARVWPHWEPGK